MYIDDDQDDHLLFTEALKESFPQANLITAYNGRQALEYLTNRTQPLPDCIFLDINMPEINGIECLQAIRKSPLLNNIPVTVLTTGVLPKDVNILNTLKAPVVIKPSTFDDLKDSLLKTIPPGNREH